MLIATHRRLSEAKVTQIARDSITARRSQWPRLSIILRGVCEQERHDATHGAYRLCMVDILDLEGFLRDTAHVRVYATGSTDFADLDTKLENTRGEE